MGLLVPTVSTVGLVVHYKLYDGSVFDYSLTGNNGTAVGTNIAPAYPGYSLNGTDDYIDVGATLQSTFRGSFSISLWFKADDGQPASSQYFFGYRDATGLESKILLGLTSTGKISFGYKSEGNGGNDATTGVLFSDGAQDWHHLMVVADSTTNGVGGKKIYMDGAAQTLIGADDGSTLNVTFSEFTSSKNLFIGAYNNVATEAFFAGNIDNVMIFNTIKSAQQVKSIYEQQRWRYKI